MRVLEEEVASLRHSDCTVLILGETGTGKSVLARRIHALGARACGPFVDVNCAGLTNDFVESELFGHERGAFTGAYATRSGLLEAAHGGTLFLDEIGDMDARVQPKVLKVLEEKRFRRMGDLRERSVDVRLVAATHCDLLEAVARGAFRQDLYYRISTVTLTMPPLRERREDLLPIAAEMLARLAGGTSVPISDSAADKLHEHSWPGNLRELRNVLERALLRRRSEAIQPGDLCFDPVKGNIDKTRFHAASPPPPVLRAPSRLLGDEAGTATRDEIEREHIELALAVENGRVMAAARRLGISRSTLYSKMKLYAIARDRSRTARAHLPVATAALPGRSEAPPSA
jgi:transcriptional regulator with GAF, ATPase, and Fis domain